MKLSKVKYEVREKIAVIAMNSPQNLNAFDEQLIDELVCSLAAAEEDKRVKAVVLTSTGKAFSAGGDIGTMYKEIKKGTWDFKGAVKKMAQVSLAIKKIEKPVIAAVRGAAAGAGFNVVLACDYVVAAANASFIQAFVNIGLIPDAGGMYLLTRALGVNKVVELAMTGRSVSAVEAKQLGFVAEVVNMEEFEKTVDKVAERFSLGPGISYAQMKRLVWESEFKDFENYIEKEIDGQMLCGATEDFKEGVCAFVEKRRPVFK